MTRTVSISNVMHSGTETIIIVNIAKKNGKMIKPKFVFSDIGKKRFLEHFIKDEISNFSMNFPNDKKITYVNKIVSIEYKNLFASKIYNLSPEESQYFLGLLRGSLTTADVF